MATRTPKPVKVTCAVASCQQEWYLYQMAETPAWEVHASNNFVVKNVTATWCRRCDRRRCRKDSEALRAEIGQLREAMCLRAPTGKLRTCKTCGEERDESVFPYRLYEDKKWAMRTHTCIACKSSNRRPERAMMSVRATTVSPYDRAMMLVERASGKEITAWGRKEHEAHCLLMREACQLPHARLFANDSHCNNKVDSNIEALWERRVVKTYAWVGLERASPSTTG